MVTLHDVGRKDWNAHTSIKIYVWKNGFFPVYTIEIICRYTQLFGILIGCDCASLLLLFPAKTKRKNSVFMRLLLYKYKNKSSTIVINVMTVLTTHTHTPNGNRAMNETEWKTAMCIFADANERKQRLNAGRHLYSKIFRISTRLVHQIIIHYKK